MNEEHEQKVAQVVERFRELESGPAGGVEVSLPGAPDTLPVYAGGARAFTPAAASILKELWELTQSPDGGRILIEAYWRFHDEGEEEL
jgi:hypothetical protein